jgi:hypothetical protein
VDLIPSTVKKKKKKRNKKPETSLFKANNTFDLSSFMTLAVFHPLNCTSYFSCMLIWKQKLATDWLLLVSI